MDWLQPLERNLATVGTTLDAGWRPHLVDMQEGPVQVSRRGSSQAYVLKYVRNVATTSIASAPPDSPLLLASDHISVNRAAQLRQARVQHLDASGNMFIQFGDVYIDIQGRKNLRPGGASPVRGTNQFSAQRARVVMALLAWPRLAGHSMREVSQAAGVSLGTAHTALSFMESAGYLHDSKQLTRRRKLLQQWVTAYPANLGPSLSLAAFHGDPLDIRKPSADEPVFLSGESALPTHIRPITATLYAETYNPRMAVINRWRTDAEPNIFLRKKFWVSPESKEDSMVGFQTAPWPLIYADLLASGEPRQLEVANAWVENLVGLDDL